MNLRKRSIGQYLQIGGELNPYKNMAVGTSTSGMTSNGVSEQLQSQWGQQAQNTKNRVDGINNIAKTLSNGAASFAQNSKFKQKGISDSSSQSIESTGASNSQSNGSASTGTSNPQSNGSVATNSQSNGSASTPRLQFNDSWKLEVGNKKSTIGFNSITGKFEMVDTKPTVRFNPTTGKVEYYKKGGKTIPKLLGGSEVNAQTTNNAQTAQQVGGATGGKSGGMGGGFGGIASAARNGLNMMGNMTGLTTQEPDEGDAIAGAASDLAAQFGPWGLLAAGIIDSLNFVDKAAGKKVKGFEGNTGLSGYQDFSKESTQFRLTTTNKANRYQREIDSAKQLYAKAQTNADSQKQKNQAALQSADQVAMRNQAQLNNLNVSKSILAKQGSKLDILKHNQEYWNHKQSVKKFRGGGSIELTSTPNVIPEGALHSRKHGLDNDEITNKGIPVISLSSGDIKPLSMLEDGDKITQHAEIERDEIIFNIELTKKLEQFKKDFDATSNKEEKNKIALECGKILEKEILNNTNDNTGLITKLDEN